MKDPRSGARQNACRACTKAKRACDRQVPHCGRCADRMEECTYPSRARRRENTALAPRPQAAAMGRLVEGDKRGSISNRPPGVRPQQSDTSVARIPATHEAFRYRLESQTLASTVTVHYAEPQLSWFLAPDSWDIKHGFVANPSPPSDAFKVFKKGAYGWLRDWAVHGHNIFLHRHLYQPGLPSCLEDAYTALVAYLFKTEETEDMVLQIIENRATSLCQQSALSEGAETLDIGAHLSRTQALLVYSFIRLFDGCPRQRALAEGTLFTMYEWCQQMRDAAVANTQRIHAELGLLRPGDGSMERATWRLWILSESLRRTWMLVSSTLSVYQAKKDGWSGCLGVLMFTTRQGLWEAPNAWQWAQQVRKQSPLFTQSVNALELMEGSAPAELDTFMNQVLSMILPSEDIDRWAAKTAQVEG